MAEKIGAKATEVSASHVSMLAKPEEVAEVIISAAENSIKSEAAVSN